MVFLRFPQAPEEILPDLGAEAARLPSGSLKLGWKMSELLTACVDWVLVARQYQRLNHVQQRAQRRPFKL
jgi:hypothetical protein